MKLLSLSALLLWLYVTPRDTPPTDEPVEVLQRKCLKGDRSACKKVVAYYQQYCDTIANPTSKLACLQKATCWQNASFLVGAVAENRLLYGEHSGSYLDTKKRLEELLRSSDSCLWRPRNEFGTK